jgi:hypothetical protein
VEEKPDAEPTVEEAARESEDADTNAENSEDAERSEDAEPTVEEDAER